MRLLAKLTVLLLPLLVVPSVALGQTLTVAESSHNLSVTGPGTVKSSGDVGVCIFCHVPHNSKVVSPLWNKDLPPDAYQRYTSSTYKQLNTGITTRSKQCLSCHDGTIALGQTIATGDLGVTSPLSAATNLGSDLRKDHPFGFSLPAQDDGEISVWLRTSPITSPDPAIQVYGNKMECVTCHDPHIPNKDNVVKKFLVRDNANGAICTTCHDPARGVLAGWSASAHATSAHTVAASIGPYGTVALNACMNCHEPHNAAGTGQRLLRGNEEVACSTCHSAGASTTPTVANVLDEISKSTYSHPTVLVQGIHDPAETLPISNTRHAECSDCHNPHVAQASTGFINRPASQSSLLGASGVSASTGTTVLQPAANEYEICLKCHADSSNKPQNAAFTDFGRTPYRQTFALTGDPYNVRLDLQSPVARHNVIQPAGNRGVVSPSLRANMLDLAGNPTGPSLQAGTYIYCTDCHNNDNARTSGGTAPAGPHGSNWQHLLERRYELNDPPAGGAGNTFTSVPYSPGVVGSYALCDKCHDVAGKVINGNMAFPGHSEHVIQVGASCSTCHAPHGIQGGTNRNNLHLINFDKSIVGPDGNGRLYIDTTSRTCYLTCHGQVHSGTPY